MAQIYYNLDESVSIELENIEDVILIRNILSASLSQLQETKECDVIFNLVDELTEYINEQKQ